MTTANERDQLKEGQYGLVADHVKQTADYEEDNNLDWNPADHLDGMYAPYDEGAMTSSSTFALTIHEYITRGSWMGHGEYLEGTVWHLLRRYRQAAGLEAVEPYIAVVLNAVNPEVTPGHASHYVYQWESVRPELRRQLRRVGFPFGHAYRNLDDAYHSFAWFYARLPARIRMGLLSGDYDARARGSEPAAGGEVAI